MRDDWTPQTLKLQMLATCLLAPTLLGAVFWPVLWACAGVLLALTIILGWPVVRTAIAALRPRPAVLTATWAVAFLLVRSFTLAGSVVYDRLTAARTP